MRWWSAAGSWKEPSTRENKGILGRLWISLGKCLESFVPGVQMDLARVSTKSVEAWAAGVTGSCAPCLRLRWCFKVSMATVGSLGGVNCRGHAAAEARASWLSKADETGLWRQTDNLLSFHDDSGEEGGGWRWSEVITTWKRQKITQNCYLRKTVFFLFLWE